jgi:hypothetical protein
MEWLLLHAMNPQQKKNSLEMFICGQSEPKNKEKFKICEGVGWSKRCSGRKEVNVEKFQE